MCVSKRAGWKWEEGGDPRASAIGIFPLLCVSLLPQDMGCQCHTYKLPINPSKNLWTLINSGHEGWSHWVRMARNQRYVDIGWKQSILLIKRMLREYYFCWDIINKYAYIIALVPSHVLWCGKMSFSIVSSVLSRLWQGVDRCDKELIDGVVSWVVSILRDF